MTEAQQAYIDGHCDGYARGYADAREEMERQRRPQMQITGKAPYETKQEAQKCEQKDGSTC